MAKEKNFHEELALHMATKYAKMLMPRLLEIVASVCSQGRDASYTVTAQFTPKKGKHKDATSPYTVLMKPRVRTPEDVVVIDLLEVDGQLALYESNEELAKIRAATQEPAKTPPPPAGNGGDGAGATSGGV
jgi:hypothetical protein